MASAVHKITLSPSRDIPFNKLVLSQSNVRLTKAGVSIEELAEDIAHRTLLQSLNVRPVLDVNGVETGMYEVPAGGRRFRALQLLVKQKRMAKTQLVPCIVRDGGIAEEDSLAENVQRVALHPLDQFRAFRTLRDNGLREEEIAARFFVAPAVVKQRLRLAAVSEKLHDLYAEDAITLDQLMAFTVTNDHARQEQVWEGLQRAFSKEPHQIRRLLTESAVRAYDRRARFVGIDAYEQAGGYVLRDLFQQDNGGWLEDVALLDRLVADKLKAAAETTAAEGWKWIEAAIEFPYDHDRHLRALDGAPADLTVDEQATYDALKAEYVRLETEHENADELPDDVDERLGEIETALEAFDARPAIYDPADIARAGVFISIDAEGDLCIDRGYVRPEDEPREDADDDADLSDETSAGETPSVPAPRPAIITIGGVAESEEDEDDVIKPLPDRLVSELTAHRTLALRDALARRPDVAMTALLHKLCSDAFNIAPSGGCLEVSVRHVGFAAQGPDLKTSASALAIDDRHKAWARDLPRDENALWDALAALDDASRSALLAHCVSFGVNALREKANPYGAGPSVHGIRHRLCQADRLAQAIGLDMVEVGWRPSVDNYLGRVTKPRILDAVREAKGEGSAQLIDHLKKGEMAKEAERLLDGSGWLPEPLRPINAEMANGEAASAPTDALPDFLSDDDEADAEFDEDAPALTTAR